MKSGPHSLALMTHEFPWVAVDSQVPDHIDTGLRQIGPVVAPAPTEALYAPLSERAPFAGLTTRRDIPYGPDARHLLDVFAPDRAPGGRPILVFVHGGAFIRGDRRIGDSPFNDNIAVWAARHGMVGVNITYRLAPTHGWPAAQNDIRQALQWLGEHASEWGGDAGQIILMGHSAGAAHVAQYLAFPRFHLSQGAGIQGSVMLSGLFDPATADPNPPLRAYFGDDAARYPEMSAVPGLVASALPQLYAFAALDPEDFVRQAHQMARAMRAAGKVPAVYQLNGHSHMSEIYSINTPDDAFAKLLLGFVVAVTGQPLMKPEQAMRR